VPGGAASAASQSLRMRQWRGGGRASTVGAERRAEGADAAASGARAHVVYRKLPRCAPGLKLEKGTQAAQSTQLRHAVECAKKRQSESRRHAASQPSGRSAKPLAVASSALDLGQHGVRSCRRVNAPVELEAEAEAEAEAGAEAEADDDGSNGEDLLVGASASA
jgi:hypothetical protein